jgi:hypothetical protein
MLVTRYEFQLELKRGEEEKRKRRRPRDDCRPPSSKPFAPPQ